MFASLVLHVFGTCNDQVLQITISNDPEYLRYNKQPLPQSFRDWTYELKQKESDFGSFALERHINDTSLTAYGTQYSIWYARFSVWNEYHIFYATRHAQEGVSTECIIFYATRHAQEGVCTEYNISLRNTKCERRRLYRNALSKLTKFSFFVFFDIVNLNDRYR